MDDPHDVIKAYMKYRVETAIWRENRQKEQELEANLLQQKLDNMKWAAKQAKKDRKKNKKKYPSCFLLRERIGVMIENGASETECYEFAHMSSKKGRLAGPIDVKLKEAFPRPEEEPREIQQHNTTPVPSPDVDEDSDRAEKFKEIRRILLSRVQSPPPFTDIPLETTPALPIHDKPSYIPDDPEVIQLYEQRLREFGPVPDDARLLHIVYNQLVHCTGEVPTDSEVQEWAGNYWQELFLRKHLDARMRIGAGKIHSAYSIIASASQALQRARADLCRRISREKAEAAERIVERVRDEKPRARLGSMRSSDVTLKSRTPADMSSDPAYRCESVKIDDPTLFDSTSEDGNPTSWLMTWLELVPGLAAEQLPRERQ